MNTTITKDQMLLKDNEVYVYIIPDTNIDGIQNFTTPFIFDDKMVNVTHSTAKLDGVKPLQREWFVKGEDVEEMAQKFIENTSDFDGADDGWIRLFKNIFKAGYNAKKGDFTKQQLIDAMYDAFEYPNKRTPEATITEFIERYVRDLQPLTVPSKIVLSPDGELIEIQW